MKTSSFRFLLFFRVGAVPALALFAMAGLVHGQTVMVSNLDEEAGGYGSFANETISSEPYVFSVASDFTTGSEESTLHSITLLFDENSAGSGFVLSLYSDGGGQPGSLLEILSGESAPNNAAAYTYASTGTILEANTTYWWIGTVEDGQFNYHGTYSSSETSPAGWTIGNLSSYTQLNGGEWETTGGFQTRFEVSIVSQVPETSAYGAFAGMGVLGFVLVRRRCIRKSR